MTTTVTRDERRSSGQLPTTGAEVFVKQLEDYGVEVVFGLCGPHQHRGPRCALAQPDPVRHDPATRAGHGPHGRRRCARMTGKPGLVLVPSDPG